MLDTEEKRDHKNQNIKQYMMSDSNESAATYIRLVHRLIEECLLFNMDKEECMKALSDHANIQPVVTSTVWQELEKENKEFFESYSRWRSRQEEGTSDDSISMQSSTSENSPPAATQPAHDDNNNDDHDQMDHKTS